MAGRKIRARRAAMGALLLILVVTTALLLWAFAHPSDADGAVPLRTGWRARIEGEEDFTSIPSLGHYIRMPVGRALTMTRTMTERAAGASILIHLNYLRARIWIGDTLIYTNQDDPPGPDVGIRDALIPLPEDYLGQDLTVEVSSDDRGFSDLPDPILFGSAQALAAYQRGGAAGSVALMFPLLLSGLALMVFASATGAGWDGFWFGLSCALFSLWLPGHGASYLGALEPRQTGLVLLTTFCLCPAPLLWFVYLKCDRARRFALPLAAAYSAAAAGAVGAACLGLLAPPEASNLMIPVLLTAVVGALLLAAAEWLGGNPFFRMTAPAFLVLVIGGGLTMIDVPGYLMPRTALICGVLLLALLVWADILRAYLARRRLEVEQRQLLSMREHLACEQLEAADAQNSETWLLRHEIRHHLSALSMLHREEKFSEMGEYLAQLDAQEQALSPARYCEHPLINAILSKASRDCARHGVAFSCEAGVPSVVAIPDSDLGALLLNMLDNACEAARHAEGAEKWVSIQLQIRGKFLAIRCANSLSGGVQRDGERFTTTKKDARFHGYGILAMKRVAERNGGKLNIDYDDGRFSVKAILRLGDADAC